MPADGMIRSLSDHYDAIIVGGRIAGSSLAIRLAGQNLRVLLVDRAEFPSWPQVPSSPIIHAGTMRLMDELGFAESDYTFPDGIITEYALTFVGHFQAFMPAKMAEIDRNYGYGIDRNHMDTAMWVRASETPNVTAHSQFSVVKILKEEGRVTGIIGKDRSGREVHAAADFVVGADGRFSFTAHAVGAQVVEERNEYIGASYHAEWADVEPLSADHPNTLAFYNTARGFAVVFIPIDTRKYIVGDYFTMDKANFGPQKLESKYLDGLQSIPEAWRRLKYARRTTEVVGVKGIQNGYRSPSGPGWVLAGDAVHYKDPIDGQGMYDALLGTDRKSVV